MPWWIASWIALRLAVGATGADHEVVGVADHPAQVELDDVERLAVRRRARRSRGELPRVIMAVPASVDSSGAHPCHVQAPARVRWYVDARPPVGDVVADRLPGPDAPADHRRGDRRSAASGRTVPARRRAGRQRLVDVGARGAAALRYRQRRQRQHPLWLAPLRQPGRDVTADDQEQLAVWRLRMQFLKGIDRVGRARRGAISRSETSKRSSSRDRQPAQLEPVLGPGLVLDRLVRGYPAGISITRSSPS